MTGFGRSTLQINGRSYIIEIKTVNNKYSDISIKLPRIISFVEEKIKKQIAKEISRGKVDVFVNFTDYNENSKNVVINKQVANKYIEQLQTIAEENELDTTIDITKIATLPLVLTPIENEETEDIEEEILQCSKEALNNLVNMRETEGEQIKKDLECRIEKVEALIKKIYSETTGLIEEYVVKLEKRVGELLKTDIAKGKKYLKIRLITEMPYQFFRYYILKRQFLNGWFGFINAVSLSFFRFLKIAKWVEYDLSKSKNK